jgi:hypothetical protein
MLASIIRIKRKKDKDAEKNITKQNNLALVGFRNAYVFDVSQTEGVELPIIRIVAPVRHIKAATLAAKFACHLFYRHIHRAGAFCIATQHLDL